MANAVTTVISDMLKTVDQTSEAFIETAYSGLGLQVEFLFRSMLILYVVWWGYMILAGRANGSPIEIAFKLMRAFFIYFMATNWDAFAATLFVLAQKVPDLVSDTIIKAVAGSAGLESGSDDVSGVVRILDAVFEAALKIWEQVTSDTLGYITGAFVGTVVFVFAMFFIGFAVAAILAAKLMLAITLAMAPVFIILALYQYTTRYTDGFLTLVAQLVVGRRCAAHWTWPPASRYCRRRLACFQRSRSGPASFASPPRTSARQCRNCRRARTAPAGGWVCWDTFAPARLR